MIFINWLPCSAGDGSVAEGSRPLDADEVRLMEPKKLRDLIVNSQDQFEITPELEGVLLESIQPISNTDDPRKRTLVLEGRIRNVDQTALIVKVVTQGMKDESFWNTSDDEFLISPEKLEVMTITSDVVERRLAAAIEYLRNRQFDKADSLLTFVLADSRSRDEIHYWKVANCIAQHQNDRATRRLEFLLRRNPAGSDAYSRKLTSLQGPIRQAMREMELQILSKSSLGTKPTPK